MPKDIISINNHLLSDLPSEEYERIASHIEPIDLPFNQVIHRAYDPMPYVYFPNVGMISIVSRMTDGSTVEVGVVGSEGIAGISVIQGIEITPNENVVQLPGNGIRIKSEVVKEMFKQGGIFQERLLRYMYVLTIQVSQTAACNRLHSVEERLTRWLLMSHDRAGGSDDLHLTQEFIAIMLGTRRAGVTIAAMTLQAEGLISYKRGHIRVLDRKGMEEFVCECYEKVRTESDRVSTAK
jgi:CRP-like cAMP-binding protein